MPEVNVEINGRKYRMACEEGQQGHLIALAERFNASVEGLKGAVGEIGDNRLTVMAGSGVNAGNVAALLTAGVDEIHASCSSLRPRNDVAIDRLGFAAEVPLTEVDRVIALRAAIDRP